MVAPMTSITTALRRTVFLLVTAAGVGAVVSWRRRTSGTPAPSAPPQWPPLPDQSSTPVPSATPVQPIATETTLDTTTWLPALDDGSVPESHSIKANDSSKIFHVPGGRFYDRAKPERCYATAAAAEADGYRPSKS